MSDNREVIVLYMAIKIFVSGTFDILHAGHIQFFKEAKALGDELIVNFCSAKNLVIYKKRRASMPDDNKQIILESIRYIDRVYKGTEEGVWDFVDAFKKEMPNYLVVTEDDVYKAAKEIWCHENGAELIVLNKTPYGTPTSTTEIRKNICVRP